METFINDLRTKLKELNSKRLKLLILNVLIVVMFSVIYFMVAFYLKRQYDISGKIIRYSSLPLVYFIYHFLKKRKETFSGLYNDFILKI